MKAVCIHVGCFCIEINAFGEGIVGKYVAPVFVVVFVPDGFGGLFVDVLDVFCKGLCGNEALYLRDGVFVLRAQVSTEADVFFEGVAHLPDVEEEPAHDAHDEQHE